MKRKKINFYSLNETNIYPPEPSSQHIPDWYREKESYLTGKKCPFPNGQTSATIKKCLPVFDSLTTGYLIFLQVDLYYKNGDFVWANSTQLPHIETHVTMQATGHPNVNINTHTFKFKNSWVIETPKNYSCLITQPKHRDLPFTILDGVVDTDKYYHEVNFPFVMNDPDWEGIIPAGTPIAQVIPFKRDNFEMAVPKLDENRYAKGLGVLHNQFFDRYRKHFWTKKQYK